jgi:Uma2 family endonuclease
MTISLDRSIVYPDSDGQPMADNTLQFQWIVLLKENLEILFAHDPQVFVAGDLLWYPVEGHPEIRVAPDVLVALGRPKGDRGSYKQWQEDGVVPQVVFEILSPGNTVKEMAKKQAFYSRYGVKEYYVYDPEDNEFTALWRKDNELEVIEDSTECISPRLNVRFVHDNNTLKVLYPDGKPFLSSVELAEQLEQADARAEQEAARAEQEAARAEQEAARAEQEAARAEQEAARAEQADARAEQADARAEQEAAHARQLAEKLRSLGINPDKL